MTTQSTEPSVKRVFEWLREAPCFYLMSSLLGLVIAYQFLLKDPFQLLVANSVVLVAGVYAVAQSRRWVVVAAALTGLHIVLSLMALELHLRVLEVPALGVLVLAFTLTIVAVLGYVIAGNELTRDKIFGAVSVYLLLGFTWAALYRILQYYNDQAILGTDVDVVYFSFVTLCTVGYGDMHPGPGLSRAFAILEGVTGVFYVAVLVSRLINRQSS